MRDVVALLLLLVPAVAVAQVAPDCGVPAQMADGWEVASPDSVGLDPVPLCGIVPHLKGWPAANVHAVLVLRHGKLVYEHYFAGADERFGRSLGVVDYSADMRHDLRSISKSVTSLLLGIAVGKGLILDIDAPVLPQLAAYADLRSPARDKITLRHLLTMSQGLTWDEDVPYSDPRNDETRMDEAADPVRYALAAPIERPPGEIWNYSGGSATIIAALMRQATGKTLDEFARVALFEPLGMRGWEWLTFGTGEPMAASGLRMRPRDLLKLGQLILDHGAWRGRQIVPASWIVDATAPHIAGPQLWFYGYQFWLGRSLAQGRPVDWIAGVGLGGQRLFVAPALDLVVLVNAGMYRSAIQGAVPLAVLNQHVLAAVRGP